MASNEVIMCSEIVLVHVNSLIWSLKCFA